MEADGQVLEQPSEMHSFASGTSSRNELLHRAEMLQRQAKLLQ